MCKKLIYLVPFLFLLCMGLSPAHGQAGLVGYWRLDESSGTIAADMAGGDNDGTLSGDVEWRPSEGKAGGALFYSSDDNTARVEIPTTGMSASEGTMMVWGNLAEPYPMNRADASYFFGHTTQPSYANRIQLYMDGNNTILDLGLGYSHTRRTDIVELQTESWYHVALTWDSGRYVVYLDGEEIAAGSYTGLTALHNFMDIGNDGNPYDQGTEAFAGLLDEVRLYDHALTPDEVQTAMKSAASPKAWGPSPNNGASHPGTWVTLSWMAGDSAVSHDVYLGDNFDHVNSGTGDTFRGNQPSNDFLVGLPGCPYPDGLVPGTTYYWRIDEVETDGVTKHRGRVWSFFMISSKAYNPVPPDHPRVYVRPADLASIMAKLNAPEFTEDWTAILSDHRPLSRAFVYLMTGDESMGRIAVTEGLSELKQCTDARIPDNAMHWGACVYDWCYDLITSRQRQEFIREFARIAASHAPGYPASPNGHAVVGHETEGWLLTDQLPAGLAIYDESPQMFEAAAQLFFSKFVPVRNFFYPSHMDHQGDSYIGTRLQHDLLASWLFRRIGAGDVFTHELQYVPYQLIYHLRPDGQQMRSGDTYDTEGRSKGKRRLMMLAGAYYEDPYLLTMADSDFYYEPSSYDRIFKLLFLKPGLERRPLYELPVSKYFSPPMGEMIARTGWRMGMDSPDAVVHMRIGEYFFGNHQRKDFGTFQIYHRGPLAIASGLYEGEGQPYGSTHWLNYHHQTIAHNGLLIYDPSEVMAKGAANDGGQRWPNKGVDHPRDLSVLLGRDYRMGQVTAHAIEPDPAAPVFSYLAGDITEAYAARKVEKVTRSMVTVNTGDSTRPCVLVVFDRVISTNPLFKKTWLLHSIQEPEIRGTTSFIFRNGRHYNQNLYYRGKLIVESLLPEDVSVKKIGGPGREFWIESTNRNYPSTRGGAAEPGAWRIEVSPTIPNRLDTFLHVLTSTVMGMRESHEKAAELVSNPDLVGASFVNHAVFFSRDGHLLQTMDVPLGSSEEKSIFICDLRPGLWIVKQDSRESATVRVSEQSKSLYLEKAEGLLRLEYLSP